LKPKDVLLENIDFQREKEIIDLTNYQVTASALKEAKLFCLLEEKVFLIVSSDDNTTKKRKERVIKTKRFD